MTKDVTRGLRVSRFAFQTGMGALTISLVWGVLTNGEWQPERTDLIPLILFGLAFPMAVVSIPAQIVSSATASGRFLMSVSVLLAVLALGMSFGRLFFSWDRIFVVVLTGLIVSIGISAQMLWARLWDLRGATGDGALFQDGILSYGGWLAGSGVAPLLALLGGPHFGLWFAAIALFTGGWLIQFVPRKSSSANWLSNRSALRLFAAIENSFRNRHSRLILLRVFWFAGAFLSLAAAIPGGWTSGFGISLPGGTGLGAGYSGLAAVLLASLAGMAFGSSRWFIALAEARPSLVLTVVCLAAPAAGMGIVFLPVGLKVLPAFFLGGAWGAVMSAASRDLRRSLGRGFAAESEALLLTITGCGGLVFLSCIWPAHEVFGFGPLLLIVEILLFAGFAFVWKRGWIVRAEVQEDESFDPWYPGRFVFRPEEANAARLISVTYEVPKERRELFGAAIRELAHLRQKQGALYWTLAETEDNPDCLKEQFIVESLSDYQEAIRSETERDREIKQRVFDLNHWDSLPYETQSALLDL